MLWQLRAAVAAAAEGICDGATADMHPLHRAASERLINILILRSKPQAVAGFVCGACKRQMRS
jgi:hypothetical protein